MHFDEAGTLSNLRVKLGTNSMASGTFEVGIWAYNATGRSGGTLTDTGIKFTVTTSDANKWMEDNTNTYALPANTDFCVKLTGSGDTNTCTISNICLTFKATNTSNTVTPFLTYGTTTLSAGGTEFLLLTYTGHYATEDASVKTRAPCAGTWRNLTIVIGVKTGTCTGNVRARLNGASQSLAITGIGATGTFEDTSNSVSVAQADDINWQHDTSAGTGGCRVTRIYAEYVTTTGQSFLVSNHTTTALQNAYYMHLSGTTDNRSVRADKQCKPAFPSKASNLYWMLITYSSGSAAVTLEDDSSSTSLTASGSASATWCVDTTNKPTIAADSLLNWITSSGTSSNKIAAAAFALEDTTSTATLVDTGLSTETDTALGLGKVKIRAVGVASETDTAIAPAVAELRAIGVSEETDTALDLGRVKITATGLTTETDTALDLGRLKTKAVATSTETDTALDLARSKVVATGVASETDASLDLGRVKLLNPGIAAETDTALALSLGMAVSVGMSLETDTSLALGRVKIKVIGVASETDTGIELGRAKIFAVGAATEVDTAVAPSKVKIWAMGQATETDTALALALAAGGQRPVAYGLVIV